MSIRNCITPVHCAVRILSLASATVLVAACGIGQPKTAPVRGTVTLNGKPLNTGTVTFIPEEANKFASGRIGADGTYELTTFRENDGAVIGGHRITVTAVVVADPNLGPAESLLPAKYGSDQTSGLRADVKDIESNSIDLELQGSVKRR